MTHLFAIPAGGTIGIPAGPAASATSPAPTRDRGALDAGGHRVAITAQAGAKTGDGLAPMFGTARSAAAARRVLDLADGLERSFSTK